MKTLLAILLLAGTALAGPGSWTATESSGYALGMPNHPLPSGNDLVMDVEAGSCMTMVDVDASTDLLHADESGSGDATYTTWFTLAFSGSNDCYDFRWAITTTIYGSGLGSADACLEASTWGDSVQAIKCSGDNTNYGIGTLGVEDGSSTRFSISAPDAFTLYLNRSSRQVKNDSFQVKAMEKSEGPGKACRVRVDSWAEAKAAAASTVSNASTFLGGHLRANVEMMGTCKLKDGTSVKDVFQVLSTVENVAKFQNKVVPPTGGYKLSDDIPTDKPTTAERNGETDPTSSDSGTQSATSTSDSGDSSTTTTDGGSSDSTSSDGGSSDSTSSDGSSSDSTTSDGSSSDSTTSGDGSSGSSTK